MKFIKPTTIDNTVLISSNRAEDDYAAWASATTYGLGDHAISTALHRIYESVQAANLNHDPAGTAAAAWWLDIGPTNRWAMFDDVVGTVTERITPLTVEIAPGICNALALLDIDANTVEITITDGTAATAIVFGETYDMGDQALLESWYDYFFAPIDPRDTLIVEGLPPYNNAHITVTVSADSTAQTVGVGTLVIGSLVDLGQTLVAPSIGIIDYSRKQTDDFGAVSVVERSYAKKIEASFLVETRRLDYIARRLAEVRAAPVVWIADDRSEYGSLVAFGFYRDWGINIKYADYAEAGIEIEGLT